jgi:DnaK suppressor protein
LAAQHGAACCPESSSRRSGSRRSGRLNQLATHLTEPQRDVLERLLRAQIAALRESVATAREGLPQREPARTELQPDPHALQHRIVLRDALRRMRGPDYGTCGDCSAEIPYGRLAAEPQAARCLACESVHERSLAR